MDISEAFDSVFWEYLLELLQPREVVQLSGSALHFIVLCSISWSCSNPGKWCNCLVLLFTSSSSAVQLNGIRDHGSSINVVCGRVTYLFILTIDSL
jgi:hypothetical protein